MRRAGQPPSWWIGTGLVLGLPALPGLVPRFAPPTGWALHPGSGLQQNPFHLLSCAWVHANVPHLAANLAGLALVMGLGWTLRLPRTSAVAWLLSWPLTHLLLLLDTRLATYYGLSGVLHAGVAVVAVALIQAPPVVHAAGRWHAAPGWILLAGLFAKCWLENPQMQALLARPELSMNVAPMSHLAGALAGTGVATTAALFGRRRGCSKSPP